MVPSGLRRKQWLVAGTKLAPMKYEKIKREKIITGMMFSGASSSALTPRQSLGIPENRVYRWSWSQSPHQRPFEVTLLTISSHFRESNQFVGLSEYFLFCPTSCLPLFHSPGSQLSPFKIYSRLDSAHETRTTSSTIFFSYSDIISQMMELFNMKENTKKILIFLHSHNTKCLIPN